MYFAYDFACVEVFVILPPSHHMLLNDTESIMLITAFWVYRTGLGWLTLLNLNMTHSVLSSNQFDRTSQVTFSVFFNPHKSYLFSWNVTWKFLPEMGCCTYSRMCKSSLKFQKNERFKGGVIVLWLYPSFCYKGVKDSWLCKNSKGEINCGWFAFFHYFMRSFGVLCCYRNTGKLP